MKNISKFFNYTKKVNIYSMSLKNFSGDHHHISGKIDADRKFVPLSEDRKSLGIFSVCGLPSDKIDQSSFNEVVEHGPKHLLNSNPFDIINRPTKLKDVPMEENPYVHDDVYGYTLGDDVSFMISNILCDSLMIQTPILQMVFI